MRRLDEMEHQVSELLEWKERYAVERGASVGLNGLVEMDGVPALVTTVGRQVVII